MNHRERRAHWWDVAVPTGCLVWALAELHWWFALGCWGLGAVCHLWRYPR